MNRENVIALRDFVRDARFKFDMCDAYPKTSCGSAGCIGGHAAVLWPSVADAEEDWGDMTWNDQRLAEKLGIEEEVHHQLCYPADWEDMQVPRPRGWLRGQNYASVTREDAVRVLTKLAKTGEIDWSK